MQERFQRLALVLVAICVAVLGLAVGSMSAAASTSVAGASAVPSAVSALPQITGNVSVGSKLTVTVSYIRPPAVPRYQWLRNGVTVGGAVRSTYLIGPADVGSQLSVRVIVSQDGQPISVRTSIRTIVVPIMKFAAVTPPSITGDVAFGAVLTAHSGTWSPLASRLTYRWLREGTPIVNATGTTYRITGADAGARITVQQTAARPGFLTTSRTSVPTVRVPAATLTVSGPLATDTVWSTAQTSKYVVDPSFRVPAGISLTIQPGVVVAGAVNVAGTLRATGTADAPVVFESRGVPGADWTPFGVEGQPSFDLSHIEVRAAGALFDTSPSSTDHAANLRIVDSSLNACITLFEVAKPVMQRNTITATGDCVGLSFDDVPDVSGVALAGVDTNVFTGSARHRAVDYSGSAVPSGASLVLTTDPHVSAYLGLLSVAGTVHLDPGVVVKGSMSVTGVLSAEGSAASPVIFTSAADDLAGGDTDLEATLPTDRPASRIDYGTGAVITLSFVDFKYGENVFGQEFAVGDGQAASQLEVTDSRIGACLNLSGLHPVAARNTIAALNECSGLSLDGVSDVTGVAIDGADANQLTGTAQQRTIAYNYSTLPAGKSLTFGRVSGVSAFVGNTLSVNGSLRVEPAVVVKLSLDVYGSLVAEGTATDPVIFTSYNDDTAGGDSDGYPETTGFPNTWTPFGVTGEHASIDLSHVDVRFAGSLFAHGPATEGIFESVRIVDSSLQAAVDLYATERPVIERNQIHSTYGYGIVALSVGDITGITISGPDTNTLHGTPTSRTVSFQDSFVPAAATYSFKRDGNISAFVGRPWVYGTLNIEAGVVVKGSTMVLGHVVVTGTAADPVIFTDLADDTAGGDTNAGDEAGIYPNNSYFNVYSAGGGSVDLQHVEIRHGGSLFYNYAFAHLSELRIVDSTVNACINVVDVARPILQRNVITANADCSGISLSGASDVTAVTLKGSDRNNFVGDDLARTISFRESEVPAGSSYALTTEGNVSAYLGGPGGAGHLTIEAGVIVKGGMSITGELTVSGTDESPVVFTSYADDAFGGDTGGGPDELPSASGGPLLQVLGGGSSTIHRALFRYSGTGLYVGQYTHVQVSDSKFVNTLKGIDVAHAASNDPGLSYFYGNLPCAPPYNSMVNVSNTWFGDIGVPGFDFDVTQLGGILIDGIADDDDLSFAYSQMTSQFDLHGQTGPDTIPWSMYSCTVPGTVVTIQFPVTPVILDSVATSEWLPEYGEG